MTCRVFQAIMFLLFSYRLNMNLMSFVQWTGTLVYKKVILGKVGPGRNMLKNRWLLARFALYRRFKELPGDQIFSTLLGDTFIGLWGLRNSGVAAGRDVFATGIGCFTPDALILGDYMCSGGQSVANCIDNDGIVHPIRLGMASTLGNHTILFPGADIGVGCILGSNTCVKLNQSVPANTRLQGSVAYHVDTSADLEALAVAAAVASQEEERSVISCSGGTWSQAYRDGIEVLCKLLFFNSNIDVQWGIIIIVLLIMTQKFGIVSLFIYFAALPFATAVTAAWLRVLSWLLRVNAAWSAGSASVWTLRAKMSSGVVGPMTEGIIAPFKGTPFMRALLWGLGGRIGSKAIILGGVPTEVALLEVGPGAVLDQECETSGHYLTQQKFTYIRIKLGREAWLGSSARVQAGAELQERSRLLPGSNVLPGETMQAKSIWGGIPAAPIAGK
jgi:carbonic anhydrase/acetyltransferase-like protein (isoleucine patch superfamily)